jgi:transcriptional regulator with XRE-family HTH domain
VSATAAWVARRIREARAERGLSQADLAKRTGRTQAAVSLWEGGKRVPGLDDLMDLAQALGKDLGYFFPPEEIRQPIAMLLRGTAERIAGQELRGVVDVLLEEAEKSGLPEPTIAISAITPARAASELLTKAQVAVPPIPVDVLAGACGARVIPLEMSDGLSGLVFDLDDGAVIAVNLRHGANRQRFSLAHELGHYLLDHHDRFHIDVDDGAAPGYDWQVERQANEFAAELLMPPDMVSELHATDPDVSSLARRFEVSELAMGYRLVNLGLRD